jgi:hypothetical protein
MVLRLANATVRARHKAYREGGARMAALAQQGRWGVCHARQPADCNGKVWD